MNLLQKIEFWFFSVPALVVAIGGIAHYGTWRVLWVFPISFALNSAFRFGKRLPVELLDGPRVRACRFGNWPRAYALILPIALYDWVWNADASHTQIWRKPVWLRRRALEFSSFLRGYATTGFRQGYALRV